METKDTVLSMLDTEFYHEISNVKAGMSDHIEYLDQHELGLLKLANHTIKQNYDKFKELPESILLNKYKPMGFRLNSLITFIHGFVISLYADIEDILSNCYFKGYNLNIDLNKLILDNMQTTYAQLLK